MVSRARKQVRSGKPRYSRFVLGLAKKFSLASLGSAEPAVINGGLGVLFFEDGRVTQALAFDLVGDKVSALAGTVSPRT